VLTDPSTLIPPLSVFTDPLPSLLVFGVGITLVVAPLTSTLMSSIPVRNAGIGSAINNALSRIGSPLVIGGLTVVVSGAFYSALSAVSGVDPGSAELRKEFVPLNPPPPGADAALAAAARLASTEAFHLAVIVCAALLVAGAVVNLVGLRSGQAQPEPGGSTVPSGAEG